MIKYKRIGLFVGHSKLKNGNYTSAVGIKNEYLYNKELGTKIKSWFDSINQPCDLIVCPESKFTSVKEESGYKLPIANSGKYDLIIELHLNASDGVGNGAEVLYSSTNGSKVATRIQNKLSTIFKNRKAKKRTDLYILNKTTPTAVLLETFFCDNKKDCQLADSKGTKELARLIVEGVVDDTVKETVSTTSNKKYMVNTDTLNIRSGRGTEFKIVGTLKQGQIVEIWSVGNDSKGGKWGSFRYSFNPDIIGYIHMNYLKQI